MIRHNEDTFEQLLTATLHDLAGSVQEHELRPGRPGRLPVAAAPRPVRRRAMPLAVAASVAAVALGGVFAIQSWRDDPSGDSGRPGSLGLPTTSASPRPDGTAESLPDTSGTRRPGTETAAPPLVGTMVNDVEARVSYMLPPGWTVMPESSDPDMSLTTGGTAGPEWLPDVVGRPADRAIFYVATVGPAALEGFGGVRESAKALTNIIPCPDEYNGRMVEDTKATKVDGHDAWYSEAECVLPETEGPPLRIRATLIDTGGDAVVVTGGASAPTRLAEIERITKSIRIQ